MRSNIRRGQNFKIYSLSYVFTFLQPYDGIARFQVLNLSTPNGSDGADVVDCPTQLFYIWISIFVSICQDTNTKDIAVL